MKVEVYGSEGCKKCNQLKDRVEKVVNKMGLENVEVEKVEDQIKMAQKGIMSTPAIAVDDEVKIKGEVPGEKHIANLLK